jgi:ATP-dependent DNA helicase RecG
MVALLKPFLHFPLRMRPAILNPLFASLTTLPGVGPKFERLFARLLDRDPPRVIDLLFHAPGSAIDRRNRPKLAEAPLGEVVTLQVRVLRHQPGPPRGRAPHRVVAEDETGTVELVYFRVPRERIERMLPVGEVRYISGTLALYDGRLQMTHPDRVADEAGFARIADVEPVYPLTEGLAGGIVARAANAAASRVPSLPEWQDRHFLKAQGFASFEDCLRRLHEPAEPAEVAPGHPARRRLAYDELLAQQLSLTLLRSQMRREAGRSASATGALRRKIVDALPFSLTPSQERAAKEISDDLASDRRMLRLLQGDVGSGKTLVALLAAAHVIEAGRQVAIMAPTEILARQHLERLQPLAAAAGIKVAILTSRERRHGRHALLDAMQSGNIDLVVGTHALFEEDVAFRDLGLVVVDEQHRFGVHQRLALAAKGITPDVLVMTATPIPRTLTLAYFGDMDVSELREKPAGRRPIDTRAIPLDRIEEVVAAIRRAIEGGARIYWICPLVEESELTDLAAAEARHAMLRETFGTAAGLAHGQLPARERDDAMAAFASGATPLLVATTVVEVGVDVPEATIMVIEQAERFGLAQLHQLRGRVGRGSAPSSCLLLYRNPLGETARRRLEILRETDDGFRIAEEDLALRGEGEVLGTRQSGMPRFRIAIPGVHRDLMETARKDAAAIVAIDPKLATARGRALRMLLYLFEREDAIRLLEAG